MYPPKKQISKSLLFNPLFYATLGTILFALIGAFMIYFSSIQFSKNELTKIINRMHEGIKYENGNWNLYYLDSDPELPGSYPHYILATNGYVIERWRPINGYLDTTNLDYILQFNTPRTITTPLQEQWRVYSKAIKNNNEMIGGVIVSRFISEEDNLTIVDQRLEKDMNLVFNKIKINGDKIDTSSLDVRATQFDISVKVIDKYNHILTRTNNSNSKDRLPNYIDKSYVGREIQSANDKIIRDNNTHEPFLVMNSSIADKDGRVVGTIIVAKSIAFIEYILKSYLISALALSAIILPIIWYIDFLIQNHAKSSVIAFKKDEGMLFIDSTPIEIPIDSHQYHLTRLLFARPGKAISADEISTFFEEPDDQEGTQRRQVYDAMLLVNKKVEPLINGKLFIIQNKKFVINPDYLDNIKK